MNRLSFYIRFVFCFILVVLISLIGIDLWISTQTSEHIYSSIDSLPHRPVAIVPGTSKFIRHDLNPFYQSRIDAARSVYFLGKTEKLLLSGDNAARNYNEPWTMKRDMLKVGIPEEDIILDYAGFRTLDTIVRAKEIFNADHFIIITQKFQCERALFIAEYKGIDAICLAVPGAKGSDSSYIRAREILARVKAVLDLYLLKIKPKFLGPKEPIVTQKK